LEKTILELAQLKGRDGARSLIVTGCLSQRYGQELLAELPEVDAILGTGGLERIVELVGQARSRADWVAGAPPGYLYDATTPRFLTSRVPYAYVKIAEGCDMGCAFCAIPQFRGKHRSRPLRDIVAEVEGLAARGIREAILVSQDTLAYGKDLPGNGDIGNLLLALSDTPIPWIRPMYLHPAHVNDRQNLLEFIEEVSFDRLGVFTYSAEEGTPAASMADKVSLEVMAERAQIIQDAQDRLAWERQRSLYGTVQTVLVDGPSEDSAFAWEGRLAGQAPEIDGVVYLTDRAFSPGQFANVRIVEAEGYELVGEPAD